MILSISHLPPPHHFLPSHHLQLLQAPSCSAPVAGTVDQPPEALLYVSANVYGTVTYSCGPNGKADNQTIKDEAILLNPEGWEGNLSSLPDGSLMIDLGMLINDTAGDYYVNNTMILDPATASFVSENPLYLQEARWSVSTWAGEKPPLGLPKIAYVTRVNTQGGGPPRVCPSGSTPAAAYESVFNFYTCESAYLPPVPAPGPSMGPVPAPGPLQPLPAPLPVPMPVPMPAPVPAPMPPPPATPPPEIAPAPAPEPAAEPSPDMASPSPTVDPVIVPSPPAQGPTAGASRAGVVFSAAAAAAMILVTI